MSVDSIEVLAPAKVNLLLRIKSKRQDGYHELETVMQKINLADRLTLEKTQSGVSIRCFSNNSRSEKSDSLPEDESNLACRAAKAYFDFCKINGGVKITLQKNIPIAAGLGGGSSDAAAVLLGLNKLYPPGIEIGDLLEIAARLGADVPFFVNDAAAVFATGIGDRLKKVKSLENCWILLVNPGFPVSTKWVYDNFALTTANNPYTLGPDLQTYGKYESFNPMVNDLKSHGDACFENDLEHVTINKYSELADIKKMLDSSGACLSLMSGSGPTVFGVFCDCLKAERCLKLFKKKFLDVFLCQPMQ